MEEAQLTRQLVSTYETEGFKHLEKWVQDQINLNFKEIANPDTPTERSEKLRMVNYAYQTILDKVLVDKANFKQLEKSRQG